MTRIDHKPTSLLWRLFLVSLLVLMQFFAFKLQGADLTKLVSGQVVNISNSTNTRIIASLQGATTIQMYIRPSSTAQVFTLTLPDGTTIEIPSGATYTMRVAVPLEATDTVCTVQTTTSAAVLQVISIREVKE